MPEKKSEASTTYYRGKKRGRRMPSAASVWTPGKEIAADEEEIQRLTEFMAGEEAASDYEKLTEAANRMEELQQGLTPSMRNGRNFRNRKILQGFCGNPRKYPV